MLEIGICDIDGTTFSSTTGKPNDRSVPMPQDSIGLWLEESHYWHFYPSVVRFRSQTGRYIDWYGNAILSGPDLTSLLETLAEERMQVDRQPPSWDVHVGTQTHPDHRELYETVHRDEILTALDTWIAIVRQAQRQGRAVFCRGD